MLPNPEIAIQDPTAPAPCPLRRRLALFALAAALAAGFGLCLWGLVAPHSVRLDCASGVLDPMEFRIRSSGINGIISLRFYSLSRREVLWDVHLWTRPLERFIAGTKARRTD